MKQVTRLIAILLLTKTISFAVDLQAEADKKKIVRNSVSAFIKTFDEPTIKSADELFAGDGDELKLVHGYFEMNHATIDTMAALRKKFPEEMSRTKSEGNGSLVNALVARLERDLVIITGKKAVVGRASVGITLREIDGVWKVTSLLSDPAARDKLIEKFKITVDLSREFIQEIEEGKYKTAKDAQTAFAARVKSATANPPATKPFS